MKDNKKKFFVGTICGSIIFLMGVLYLTIPGYYGIDNMAEVDTNNLFISATLVYSVISFLRYVLLGKNPNNETIYFCIASSVMGIFNVVLAHYYQASIVLSMSLALLVFIITGIKLFTIDYYHDRKDAYVYIESLLLAIFFVVGVVISLNLLNSSVLQTVMLGFFFIIVGILDIINSAIKSLVVSKKFLRKIKLK